jgi:hypothetical protein
MKTQNEKMKDKKFVDRICPCYKNHVVGYQCQCECHKVTYIQKGEEKK